jgi:hypothetical protein
MKAHPERINLNMAVYQMWDSYSVLACFTLSGQLAVDRDKMRHQLHKNTRLMRVSDQKLFERVANLKLINPAEQSRVLELLTEMRDLYEERGLHPDMEAAEAEAAKQGAPAVVIP